MYRLARTAAVVNPLIVSHAAWISFVGGDGSARLESCYRCVVTAEVPMKKALGPFGPQGLSVFRRNQLYPMARLSGAYRDQ
jgi:hypothetical protein